MYIEIVPNRKSRPAILLREGWREGKKIHKKTVANLTDWPAPKVEAMRRLLRGDILAPPDAIFCIERSIPHGHVEAILGVIRKIGMDTIIASKPSRSRSLVLAMIIEQIIHPSSKLGTTRLWRATTLAEELHVTGADEDDLYEAMDWLLAKQDRIERNLAKRHIQEGDQVLYDVSSSYYEGHTCTLAHFGHNRDGKKGKPIIVYGIMTDDEGRPIAVRVYPGNTGDPSTVSDQVDNLRGRFGLGRVVLIGDRGMLTQSQIENLKQYPGLGWISALRSEAIRKLVAGGRIQTSIFDQHNIAEISSPDFPGERLIACFNPLLCDERRRKRSELLTATEKDLDRIAREVRRRTKTPLGKAEIGKKVGKVIDRHKMGKHFRIIIDDDNFRYERRSDAIEREAALDGIYVIRTSESGDRLSAADAVRSYKNLAAVERLFRTLKSLDLLIRPIRHREERRVRAHIFLCMLAYYVEWHMRKALAPLLFDDENVEEDRKKRDPVAPATPSLLAKKKKANRCTDDGFMIHSLDTLMVELGTRCRNRCRMKSDSTSPIFCQTTDFTPLQMKAYQLLGLA